jgi:hypothetical protein
LQDAEVIIALLEETYGAPLISALELFQTMREKTYMFSTGSTGCVYSIALLLETDLAHEWIVVSIHYLVEVFLLAKYSS